MEQCRQTHGLIDLNDSHPFVVENYTYWIKWVSTFVVQVLPSNPDISNPEIFATLCPLELPPWPSIHRAREQVFRSSDQSGTRD